MPTNYLKTIIDAELVASLIELNNLKLLGYSEAVYGGSCPFCKHEKSFTIWADKGVFRCFWCGCDGRFVATPERQVSMQTLYRDKNTREALLNEEVSYARKL